MALRETEDDAYAKFWGDKQRALWYVIVFSGVVNDDGGGDDDNDSITMIVMMVMLMDDWRGGRGEGGIGTKLQSLPL